MTVFVDLNVAPAFNEMTKTYGQYCLQRLVFIWHKWIKARLHSVTVKVQSWQSPKSGSLCRRNSEDHWTAAVYAKVLQSKFSCTTWVGGGLEEGKAILYNTYIYTYIPWIHKCVIKTAGCGRSHKYTRYANLQCKIQQTFYKNSTINHLYTSNIHLQSEWSVYVGIFIWLL
jgi:hypothetical protein